jgi:fluoride exporter
MSPLTVLLVFVGGGAGSVARFGIGQWLPPAANGWPWATWWVNVVGCMLAGLLVGSLKLLEAQQLHPRALLLVGFCGGFTTFSAFAIESWRLFEDRPRLATAYIISSVLVSLAACLLGLLVGRTLARS